MKLIMQRFTQFLFLFVVCVASVLTLAHAAQTNQLKGVRAWPSPDSTRVVLDLSKKPDYQIHYLKKPDRVVVDLKSTTSIINLEKMANKGPLVSKLRKSAPNKKGTYRLVIDLKKESKAEIFVLAPAKPYGHRLVLDLPHNNEVEEKPAPPPKKQLTSVVAERDIIIAIDAGHGGDDPGALGRYTYEKKVTLEISKQLQKRINQQKGMRAFLVRTGDYFINLNKRSDIARKKKADFLVSIHADGFTSSKPHGASVWVLSNKRATSELGRWMEKHEAHSELLGGAGDLIEDSSSVPFLTEMFLDMSMGNAMDVGYSVGDLVVKELKQVTRLHKKKPVHASLAVLKSPDIPSILVEAGFITNRSEEKLLNKRSHQKKIANAVFQGIYKHFKESPPQDTLFAQKKGAVKHTVRSGESLSILAARYSVTTKKLKAYNSLKSNSLRVGQTIKIPPNYQLVVKPDPVRQIAKQQTVPSYHKVERGQSLSVIAAKYGTTTEALKRHNKLRSSSLAIGQKIKLPNATKTSSVKVAKVVPSFHKVKKGESLSAIAAKYGTSSAALKKYNKLRTTNLAIGQKIKLPNATKIAPVRLAKVTPRFHKVKSGESLSGIAAKYGTSTAVLKTHNKLRSTSLAIGQKIKLPTGAKTAPVKLAKAIPRIHKVKSGESLSGIAAKYGTTTAVLKKHNKLRSTSLAIGQKIKLPNGAKTTPVKLTKIAPRVHKVKSGESLSGIAAKYNTTTAALKKHNKLRSTSLAIGQKIKLPNGAKTTPVKLAKVTPRVHKVKSGESLSVIAKRYGKTTAALKAYNRLASTSLKVGQKIKIPSSSYVKPNKIVKNSVHKVKPGESLSVIAKRYGSTTTALKKYNKLRSTALSVGQKIKIPASAAKLTKHKVRSGESLSVIAKIYGTTTHRLKSFNNLRSTSLAVGQVLTIPVT